MKERKPKYAELLIGCGSSRDKLIGGPGHEAFGKNLVTLDNEPRHKPDVVWDLNDKPWPFSDNRFDEVHAYEVLEHLGSQGNAKAFFSDFFEVWRILKPGGMLCATVPRGQWVWGDPSHTRYIGPETLVFLNQEEYRKQVGKTPMSDFRSIWHGNFVTAFLNEEGDRFMFALEAIK